jgi:multicomponent Na+:H+ antiporter subunit C
MNLVLPIVVGILVAAGLYLMMRRSAIKLLIGLSLISHAANLLVFVTGGLVRGRAPLIAEGERFPPTPHADPLPQALILTAIVISFGVLAFAIALVLRTYQEAGSDDLDEMTITEQ